MTSEAGSKVPEVKKQWAAQEAANAEQEKQAQLEDALKQRSAKEMVARVLSEKPDPTAAFAGAPVTATNMNGEQVQARRVNPNPTNVFTNDQLYGRGAPLSKFTSTGADLIASAPLLEQAQREAELADLAQRKATAETTTGLLQPRAAAERATYGAQAAKAAGDQKMAEYVAGLSPQDAQIFNSVTQAGNHPNLALYVIEAKNLGTEPDYVQRRMNEELRVKQAGIDALLAKVKDPLERQKEHDRLIATIRQQLANEYRQKQNELSNKAFGAVRYSGMMMPETPGAGQTPGQ